MANINSRYTMFSFGTRYHRDKPIKDITASKGWNSFYTEISALPAKAAIIPTGMDGRPDLISTKLYGTPDYWWVICVANTIIDPFEQLVAGKVIRVPIID